MASDVMAGISFSIFCPLDLNKTLRVHPPLEMPILGGLSKVPGKFTDFEVALFTNPGDITKSSVNAAIRVASVDTAIAEMERSLRTAL